MSKKDIYKNLLLGVAIGDALGVPVEFIDRETLRLNPVTDMREYGSHQMPAGTWSDDSSLTFCLAEALTNECDLETIAQNMLLWARKNYWTARGEVFDIGITTKKAIDQIETGVSPTLSGLTDEFSNGNGSLMRIAPLVFYLMDKPIQKRFEIVRQVSSITHGHVRSVIACFYYVEFARQIIEQNEPLKIYHDLQTRIPNFLHSIFVQQSEINHFSRLLVDNIYELSENEINSSGYVVDTLEASIWSFLTTSNFKNAILKAVNLGGDADTTGAVTGGLAGLYHGIKGIPLHWKKELARVKDIEILAEKMRDKFE